MTNIKAIIMSVAFFAAAVAGAAAQQLTEIGTWEILPVFAPPAQKVLDTGNVVYYQSGGGLYAYDAANDESICYTRQNKLSDFEVDDIFYNYDKKYLLIAYSNGNMDVLYDNGRIVNLSDISDSNVSRPIKINDVSFDGDDMYLATSFGMVRYNMSRHEVSQSGVWNKNVSGIAVMGNNVAVLLDEEGLMSFAAGKMVPTVKDLTFITEADPVEELYAFDGTRLLCRRNMTQGKGMDRLTIDFESGECKEKISLGGFYRTYPIMKGKNGNVYFRCDGFFYTLSPECDKVSYGAVPEDIQNDCLNMYAGKNKIWALNSRGLACYGVSADGKFNMYHDRILPERRSVKKAHYLLPAADGRHLYAFNEGASRFKFNIPAGEQGYKTVFTADLIDMYSGDASPLSPYPVEAGNESFKNHQKTAGEYILAPTSMVGDPDDVNTYYVGTNGDGLYKVSNGEVTGYYSPDNSPLQTIDRRWIVYGVSIDRGGNLWMVTNSNGNTSPSIYVLPADKRRLPSSDVSASDWIKPDIPNTFGHMDFRILHCQKSNMIFVLDASPNNLLLAYDTRGTFNDFSDDVCRVWNSFEDQDGRTYDASDQYALAEDHDGKVWLGTNEGIVEISVPDNATNPNMIINHLKVPRNDGTNDADYLLGSSTVTDIAVDPANRKWVSTAESGLYLVNAQGNAIINHYGTDNSLLPSDYVNSVYADPQSNFLYIGTNNGVVRLSTNSSPAEENYDNIYAFPNPVRPEHYGPVYVKGLMDNSLVKITDAVGNVVHQGRSEGGLFTWDACDRTGRRVRTGVYYIYVSQSGEDSSAGAVTKVTVIN